MKMTLFLSLFLVSVTLTARPADAAEKRVLLCFPGGPGNTADAQPIVDKFLTKLAELAGWDKASGTYFNDMSACKKAFGSAPGPQVMMVPLDVYLASRGQWKLTPVATLKNEEASGRFHLVAKSGTTLADLKGKRVLTGLRASGRFLSKVAFDGKVDVETHFTLTRKRSGFGAVKRVARGRAEAAILDDNQYRALKDLPFAKDLSAVLSGPELPGAIVAGVGSSPSKLAPALAKVCTSAPALCKDMRITGFGTCDTAKLATLEKQLAP